MFHQLLTPVGARLGLSFAVATLPVVTVLLLLACCGVRPGRRRWPV